MNKKIKNKIMFGIIIILSAIIILLVAKIFFVNASEENPSVDSFAQCLTEKGVVMYGAEWCSHCQNQKKLFGDSFRFINYVDCDKNGNLCTSEGVKGFPTWKVNGGSYPGEKSFETLASLSGCKLV